MMMMITLNVSKFSNYTIFVYLLLTNQNQICQS